MQDATAVVVGTAVGLAVEGVAAPVGESEVGAGEIAVARGA